MFKNHNITLSNIHIYIFNYNIVFMVWIKKSISSLIITNIIWAYCKILACKSAALHSSEIILSSRRGKYYVWFLRYCKIFVYYFLWNKKCRNAELFVDFVVQRTGDRSRVLITSLVIFYHTVGELWDFLRLNTFLKSMFLFLSLSLTLTSCVNIFYSIRYTGFHTR